MIKFTDLRVTRDGKNLIIGAKVREDSYYDNIYIDKIIIDTEETFSTAGPSENPVYTKVLHFDIHPDYIAHPTYIGVFYDGYFYDEDSNNPGNPDLTKPIERPTTTEDTYKDLVSNEIYIWDGSEFLLYNVREITLTLDKNIFLPKKDSIDKHLFYIYLVAGGTPASDTPCGKDNITTLGVTMYTGHYYNDFMNYIKEMGDNCNIPNGLIDYILRYKVLVNSINTGHYTKANEYFNKWFKNGYQISTSNCKCGCYG